MRGRAWREAEELSEAARWAEAGAAWWAITERAAAEPVRARESARRAADAFRRDDRPAAAAKALGVALAGTTPAGADAAQLAAVLLDAGQVEAAAGVAEQAVRGLPHDAPTAERAIALDTRAGLRLVAGEVEAARDDLDALEALGVPGAAWSHRFRAAQVARLDGALGAADAGWQALEAALGGDRRVAGPAAACAQERGELEVLRAALRGVAQLPADEDALDRARAAFGRAAEAWNAVGRRAGLFRAEAWRARVERLAGLDVAAPSIDRAIAWAEDRGMVLLLADLRACRAVVRHDADDARAAARLLSEAPVARARALVLAAELGAADVDLRDAMERLRVDAPWGARALAASPDPAMRGLAPTRAIVFL